VGDNIQQRKHHIRNTTSNIKGVNGGKVDAIEFMLRIIGTILFFTPGILISYLTFKKTNLTERTAYSIVFTAAYSAILGLILAIFKVFTIKSMIVTIVCLNTFLFLLIRKLKRKYTFATCKVDKKFIFLIFITLLGVIWRLFFRLKVNAWGDGYHHVGILLERELSESNSLSISLPDLNFYTGMAVNKGSFLGGQLSSMIFDSLSFNSDFIKIPLSVFLLCSFTYIVVKKYTHRRDLAVFGSVVMAIGPVEIWQNTLGFLGGDLAYISLISLFIYFKTKVRGYSWLVFFLAITMMISYYTPTVVMVISSAGFILALVLKQIFEKRNTFRITFGIIFNKKIWVYSIILVVLSSFLLKFSSEGITQYSIETFKETTKYTVEKAKSEISDSEKEVKKDISTVKPPKPYKSNIRFLGLPVISWQDLYFTLLGFTFIFHLIFGKKSQIEYDIFLAGIPAVMLALAFYNVNMPERAFSYLAFFGILTAKIPKKLFKIFTVLSIIFLLTTSHIVASERIKFFNNSPGEIEAARWVKSNLNGILLSDERFISLLVIEDYNKVNGFEDDSKYMSPTYYESNVENAKIVFEQNNVEYFASSKRMREEYILMLNFPQEPMTNIRMYERNFRLIFDNGDVRIYKIK